MHVDENDPQLMNLTLNNASNVFKHYSDLNESVQIEIVTYGPGLHMLRSDTSPVKDRIETIAATYDGISFQACGNTMANMKKKSGKDVPLLPQASIVPSGVVHLVQRQEEGWAYIRP
jgi:intracellular sulfur oxidation DsrE/DsrF family protein